VAEFRRQAKAYSAINVGTYYRYLESVFGFEALEELVPKLVQLIRHRKKREALRKFHEQVSLCYRLALYFHPPNPLAIFESSSKSEALPQI
jgi:hypothetical protein